MKKHNKWVLIVRNIDNEYVRTEKYLTKEDAILALREYVSLAYIVTMLSHAVYYSSDKSKLEGNT